MAEALGLESLDRAVHGAVLRPGEDGYERARRVFNAMIDRRPSAIVRCADAADAVAAVNGSLDRGEEVLRPLRSLVPGVADGIAPMSYTTLQSSKDGGFPPGRQHYWKSSFLRDLRDDATDTMLAHARPPRSLRLCG
jgi:hypothetical protein